MTSYTITSTPTNTVLDYTVHRIGPGHRKCKPITKITIGFVQNPYVVIPFIFQLKVWPISSINCSDEQQNSLFPFPFLDISILTKDAITIIQKHTHKWLSSHQ